MFYPPTLTNIHLEQKFFNGNLWFVEEQMLARYQRWPNLITIMKPACSLNGPSMFGRVISH